MFENPSLITRIAIGKTIGLIVGLLGFFLLPLFLPDVDVFLRWGVLLWYITFGATIGVFGVITYHPILKMPFPWWFRSTFMGAWLNFVLTFFAYDDLKVLMQSMFGESGLMTSPFWIVAEGAIVGLIIGYFATKFGGEGKAAVDNDQ